MLVAVEVVHLPTSEVFRDDHSIFEPVLQFVTSAPGNLGAYYGFLEEDPTQAYMIVVEHHYALMNDREVYPKMLEAVEDCVAGPVRLYHVLLEPASEVAPALNAPITSIDRLIAMEPGVTSEDMLAEFSKTFAALQSGTPSGLLGRCSGKVVENDELTVICGWESSPVLRESGLQNAPVEAEFTNTRARKVVAEKTVYVKLSTYKAYQG
ncbi:hypothetical protein BC835DRAFT_1413221 [Cytidiella melzeri]|nr:hypothetical protein BC835DRAFT_1413221 [Cytidiella melzeri]